ncbi:MAG: hypothetical protein DRQ78_10270 [Epsilonproteobacteria bacterium]|nr:MAG: hypothetical protein DRQ78_10270 [Campylobacterota bacterium]
MKLLLLSLLTSATLFSQSFYVLSGVDNYDVIVANMSSKTQKHAADIKSLMLSMSKEIGVDTTGHPSTVLYFLIADVSMGDTIGLKVELALGEYVLRKDASQRIFGITYMDTKLIAPDFKDEEDVEDQLADTVEDMLEAFKLQYEDDNKKLSNTIKSKAKKSVTHETFAKDMGYETNYQTALTKAKKEGKPVMLFMITAYCPWCRKLENRILSQGDIDTQVKAKYIPLMLNLDTDKYPEQFAKTRFTPILYIIDSKDEKIVHKFVGYSSRGDFLRVLK